MNAYPTRRSFLQFAGLAGLGLASARLPAATSAGATRRNTVVRDRVATVLEDGSVLHTPFRRIESGREGPALLLVAAQHGNEIIGVEVAMRLKDICERELTSGSVWLLPLANLPAVRSRRHSVGLGPEQNNRMHPTKLNNMQRWPGDPKGNDTQRIAFALDQAIIRHCSHLVDIHCYQRMNAAETLGVKDHEPSRPMAEVTTTRFLRHVLPATIPEKGMLINQLMLKHGGRAVGMELSGQFEIPERQVRIGLASLVNIARHLRMLPGEPELLAGPRVEMRPDNTSVITAPAAGILVPGFHPESGRNLAAEDFVERGQVLGHIIREDDLERVTVTAPASGYLFAYGPCHGGACDASLPAQHPYLETGDTFARLVTV